MNPNFSFLKNFSLLKVVALLVFMTFGAALNAQEPIDLNSADVKTLSTLKHIGKKKAEAIVEYREANGKFKSIEHLTNVKGVGKDTLEANRAVLVVMQ